MDHGQARMMTVQDGARCAPVAGTQQNQRILYQRRI